MIDSINEALLTPRRNPRRRNRGRAFVVGCRDSNLFMMVRRLWYWRKDRYHPTPSPKPFQPVIEEPVTDLQQAILRLVWNAKLAGVTDDMLDNALSDRYADYQINNAVRDLQIKKKVVLIRVTSRHSPWPPMRIFLAEFSPISNI